MKGYTVDLCRNGHVCLLDVMAALCTMKALFLLPTANQTG